MSGCLAPQPQPRSNFADNQVRSSSSIRLDRVTAGLEFGWVSTWVQLDRMNRGRQCLGWLQLKICLCPARSRTLFRMVSLVQSRWSRRANPDVHLYVHEEPRG